MNISFGKMLVIAGIALTVIGALFMFSKNIPWLGKLPGDIYIQKKNFSLYFPLATSLVISIVLSLVIMLMRKR